MTVETVQVRFISLIPIDLFQKLLNTPESIYTFTQKQLDEPGINSLAVDTDFISIIMHPISGLEYANRYTSSIWYMWNRCHSF